MTDEELLTELDKDEDERSWLVLECVTPCAGCKSICPNELVQVIGQFDMHTWDVKTVDGNGAEQAKSHYIRLATPQDLLKL